MKALVTGAGGFIGRILCRMLHQEGWDVTAVDVKSHESWKHTTKIYWVGSYSDPEIYQSSKYDVVFHLGASSTLGPSVTDPLGYMDNNVSKMIKMMQFLKKNKTPVIFASSAATYGDPCKNVCLSEDMTGKPINPYGWSKLMGEHVLEQACLAHGMNAYAMRFFNVAGSYDGLGQDLDQPHILTKMSVARLKDETFYINGNKYNTYDGTCVRDYIHVADVCEALIIASHKILQATPGTFIPYNVCSGDKTSNFQLAETFSEMFGLDYEFKDVRPGDPGYLYGDNSNIKEDLNWKPTMDVVDIVESHYDYVRKQLNGN